MHESKSEATDRLRREGRWSEASRFKDETIAQFRREGMKRLEAQERSWEAMLQKFPPTTESWPASDGEGIEVEGEGSDFVGATLWVFDNLARKVTPQSAPSPGAWAMLEWARSNQDDFFKSIVPKALDIKHKGMAGSDSEAMEEQAELIDLAELLEGITRDISEKAIAS